MKISIITAAFKSETTVAEAISSVALQTYGPVEQIVVEGNSPDGTLVAIKGAAHARMRLISEPDKGIYDALNKGIRHATGDVIGFLHSDDFLANDGVLQQIASEFEDSSVEAVFSDLDYVSRANTSHVIRHWSTGPFRPDRLKYGWMPAHPTLYLRREVYDRVGNYDESLSISADYDFILRYFSQHYKKSIYIPQVLYKMRTGGISNRSWAKVYQKMGEDLLAIKRNGIGGLPTLVLKNVSKLSQFRIRR